MPLSSSPNDSQPFANDKLKPVFFGMVLRMAQTLGMSAQDTAVMFSIENITAGYAILAGDSSSPTSLPPPV